MRESERRELEESKKYLLIAPPPPLPPQSYTSDKNKSLVQKLNDLLPESLKAILPYIAYATGGGIAGWGIYDLIKEKKYTDYKAYLKLLAGALIAAAPLLFSKLNKNPTEKSSSLIKKKYPKKAATAAIKAVPNKTIKTARWPPLVHDLRLLLRPPKLQDVGGIAGLNALSTIVHQNRANEMILDAYDRGYGGLLRPAIKATGDYWTAAGRMWNTLGLLGWREMMRRFSRPWYTQAGIFGEPVFPVAPVIHRGGITVFGPPVGFVS